MSTLAPRLLFAFCVLLGLDLGAGIYETRVMLPSSFASMTTISPDGEAYMRVAMNSGKRLWMMLTPLLALVTIASLATARWLPAPQRQWQMAAASLELAVVVSTLAWFAPTIVRLMSGYRGMNPAAVASTAQLWTQLNWIRVALTLTAWVLALKALSTPPD